MAKRQLKIKLMDLYDAFETQSVEVLHYLDIETGEVLMVTGEDRFAAEAFFEQPEGEGPSFEADLERWLAEADLPDWQKQRARQAVQVERGHGSRYEPFPDQDTHEDYRDMERFTDSVTDTHVEELLRVAITDRGAFRRFREVLARYPKERDRWFAYKDGRNRQRAMDWLDELEIELVE